MRRRTYKKKNRLLRKLLRSCSSLLKAISKTITTLVRCLVEQILFEALFWITTLGLAYLFTVWGIQQDIAFYIAIAIVLGLFISAAYIMYKSYAQKKLTKHKRRGELKLAHLITQSLANQKSREWDEYQDWLHDIMLYRQQLLDEKRPRWQVSLITYWQLGVFGIVLLISKIKQVAAFVRRSL
ncbi:MAG: hypothetical protein AAF383_29380 [Cyanobacteria bacterium P01_A01_bin.83]